MLPRSAIQSSWIDAYQRLLKDLETSETVKLHQVRTHTQLEQLLARLQEVQVALTLERVPRRLESIVTLLKPVATAADVLCQGSGIPTGCIWGAFGLVVEVIRIQFCTS